MGDLKTFWKEPATESTDIAGWGENRGGDANITDGQKESANSVSGLPAQPSRYSMGEQADAEPPSLEDRMPGTIDKK